MEDHDGFVERALAKFEGCGFEIKPPSPLLPRFIAHGTMAAEALVTLGHGAEVERWAEAYNLRHEYYPVPPRRAPIFAASWRGALGDDKRVSDWVDFFGEEIDRRGWESAVATWVPRLVPGMLAALTHGLIRTAHALRTVSSANRPTPLALGELAKGLALWASHYQIPRFLTFYPGDPPTPSSAAQVQDALSDLVAAHAARFVIKKGRGLVPLVHAMTAPAALHLLLSHIPQDTHADAYDAVRACSAFMMWAYAPKFGRPTMIVSTRSVDELVAAAVAHGDEHVIKLTEALRREYQRRPRSILLAATEHAIETVERPPS